MSVSTTAIFHPLARHVWALVSERLSARVDSASRRYIYIFIFIRLLAMFGPWAPNGYLLASIPPLGDINIFLSACSPCLGPGLQTAICCVDSASRRYIYIYIFIRLLTMFGPWAPNGYLASNPLFGLAASPPLGDIPSALRPRLPPHGKIVNFFSYAPSRQHQFSIRLTADVVFITLPPPRGDISFSPHGANQFSLRLILPTR